MKDQNKVHVLSKWSEGLLESSEALQSLECSRRSLFRWKAAYLKQGPAGLIHGNRGKTNSNRVDDKTISRILKLRLQVYGEINDTFLFFNPLRNFLEIWCQSRDEHVLKQDSEATMRTIESSSNAGANWKYVMGIDDDASQYAIPRTPNTIDVHSHFMDTSYQNSPSKPDFNGTGISAVRTPEGGLIFYLKDKLGDGVSESWYIMAITGAIARAF